MRPVQYFSDEYLEQCRSMTPTEILEFVESFRILHGEPHSSKSRLISMKVPEDLLSVFRQKAKSEGIPYQTLIKKLMRSYVER